MPSDFTPRNRLERALREGDRARVVRFVAEGDTLPRTTAAAALAAPEFPEAVAMLVLKLALTPKQLALIDTDRRRDRHGDAVRKMAARALAPLPKRANAAEKRLIDALVGADSAAVVELTGKKPGTLRNFSPGMFTLLPELTREATLAFMERGFAPEVVPEVFAFLLRETENPDALAELSYRKRLMYANLLIHLLQGDALSPDEDWYPMGNSVENGCDRGVYSRPHSYCYDPRHLYRPRAADDEYEKPAHDIRNA